MEWNNPYKYGYNPQLPIKAIYTSYNSTYN